MNTMKYLVIGLALGAAFYAIPNGTNYRNGDNQEALLSDDPARHYERFCQEFVTKLAELRDEKWSYNQYSNIGPIRRNIKHNICSHLRVEYELLKAGDNLIPTLRTQIDLAKKAFTRMSPEGRARKLKLASLAGIVNKPVLATPAEHLANMEMVLANQKAQLDVIWKRSMITGDVRWRIDFINKWSFDARKSDSVISPYTGTLETTGIWRWFHKGVCNDTGNREYFRFTFAAQHGKWVLKMIERRRADENIWTTAHVPFLEPLYSQFSH